MSTATHVLDTIDLQLPDRRQGKVRTSWALLNHRRLFVTSDRLSAFDRVVGHVPGKGQMLNELAWWWFGELRDIVANHAVSLPDPNVLVAHAATPLPVEVIVRRAVTGVTKTSLWKRYEAGARVIDGHTLRDGLHKNELLPAAIITPTTKAEAGGHDEPISVADVGKAGLVAPELWDRVCDVAMQVFAKGERVAANAGLILADTKYEFGLSTEGELLLIDEVHTPDSSRYWERSTYESRVARGEEPQSMDKEIIRSAYAELGYRGDGPIPALSQHVWDSLAMGYQNAYVRITGSPMAAVELPAEPRIVRALTNLGILPSKGH